LRAYQSELEEFNRRGAALVAVSPQLPDGSLTFVEANELGFDVLSDVGNRAALDYGLVWKLPQPLVELYRERGVDLVTANGNEDWELPIPATLVVDASGVIRLVSADPDYRNRLEPSELLEALDALG
jgi:peroxiredoxin